MNGKQINEIKKQVCTELNKTSFRHDMVEVSFDVEPKGLTIAGLPECLNDLKERKDSKLGDYDVFITNIRIELKKI